jgi:hypothetical protein
MGILLHPRQLDISFDDTHAIANAGLLLAATLAERLGIQQTADQLLDLGRAVRRGPSRPQATDLVHSMLAGGTERRSHSRDGIGGQNTEAMASWQRRSVRRQERISVQ